MTTTSVAELEGCEACLLTWSEKFSNLWWRTFVMAVIFSISSLNISLYFGCNESCPLLPCFKASHVKRLYWSSMCFWHSLHWRSVFPFLKLFLTFNPLVLAENRKRFSLVVRGLSAFRYSWRLSSLYVISFPLLCPFWALIKSLKALALTASLTISFLWVTGDFFKWKFDVYKL